MKAYTQRTKLADIVSANPILLSVLERLKVKFGFGEATIAEICKKYSFSPELFLAVCNIYTTDDYQPQLEKIGKEDVIKLVDYLHTSHKYYQGKSLPTLHKKIHKLLEGKSGQSIKVLHKFYDDYDRELASHFEYEEKLVFPYIRTLVASKPVKNSHRDAKSSKMSIKKFEENHTNIETKISDLKSIVLKYLPEDFSVSVRLSVLRDIFEIEADLLRHTLVEDKLLIPLVLKLEKR